MKHENVGGNIQRKERRGFRRVMRESWAWAGAAASFTMSIPLAFRAYLESAQGDQTLSLVYVGMALFTALTPPTLLYWMERRGGGA